MPLRPLHLRIGLKRAAYTTYQAVSGSGQAGTNDLRNGEKGKLQQITHTNLHNVLSHYRDFRKRLYKRRNEWFKKLQILGLSDDVAITATVYVYCL